jgi:tripartite-type tricarboxylate transporter receptor subunit TctC
VLAPAGTPKPIVLRLNKEVVKALAKPDLAERLASEGAEPAANTPEQFAVFIKSEIAKWGRVAKAAAIEPQ